MTFYIKRNCNHCFSSKNGTATILPDGKTIKYIPNIGWSGIDSITYKITDQYGQFSTAIWQISVNAVASVGCAVVVPGCI